MKKIVLATGSAFKRQLFERLQLPFTCLAPEVDESPMLDENGLQLSLRLAKEKAHALDAQLKKHRKNYIVIGCDQAPETQSGQILHKPMTKDKAKETLINLSGNPVTFYTSVTLLVRDNSELVMEDSHTDTTTVTYRSLNENQIDRYLTQEEAWHCAGAIKSEALGISLLSEIQTKDPTALVGLPLIGLCELLSRAGLELP